MNPTLKADPAVSVAASLQDNNGTERARLLVGTSASYGFGNTSSQGTFLLNSSGVAIISGNGAANRWWVLVAALG